MQFLPSWAASMSADNLPGDTPTNCPFSIVVVLLAEAPPASARSTCSSSPAKMAVINGSAGGSSELEVLACLFALSMMSSSAGLFCAEELELELEVEAEPEFELLAPALE